MSKNSERKKSALAGAASAVLAAKAPKNLLGYEKVYHGTGTEAAKSILQTGLRKSKAGSGVGGVDAAYGRVSQKDLKGKVFTSRAKVTADNHQPKVGGFGVGRTVKARVPYRSKSRLAKDHVFENMANGTDKHIKYNDIERHLLKHEVKNLRIYRHSIHTRFIEGSKDYAGRRQFATKGNLRRYLAQAGGKARFAKGVAQAAASGASGMYAIAKGLKARKEKS